MDDTILHVACPNGHFEMELRAKSRTLIHGAVLRSFPPHPCPACDETVEWKWSRE